MHLLQLYLNIASSIAVATVCVCIRKVVHFLELRVIICGIYSVATRTTDSYTYYKVSFLRMEEHSQPSSECSSLTGIHQDPWWRCQRKRLCQHRKIGSREAVLVIGWVYLVSTYTSFMYATTTTSVNGRETMSHATVLAFCAIAILSPFAGLVSGVHFGTYKVMRIGLWLMWIGSIGTVAMLTLQGLLLEHNYTTVVSVSHFFSIIIAVVGIFVFAVNSIPFGLDQMPESSTEQITAFIHWFVWSVFAGLTTGELGSLLYSCTQMDYHNTNMICAFISAVISSIALCTHFTFHGRLIIEPASKNPVKTVFRVLKFAAKHKKPVRRSAFTYCEDERPSRLDLGKSKYGGPFMTEEVEDVKTCLRMSLVIILVSVIIVISTAFSFSLKHAFDTELVETPTGSQCYDSLVGLGGSVQLWGTIYLLVYEFTIYPLVWKRIPTTLKRVVIALAAAVLANIILLVTSIVFFQLADSGSCMFIDDDDHSPFPVSREWIKMPVALLRAVNSVYISTSILEFVCAQAPYNLRGMLVGLVFLAVLFGVPLGWGTYYTWEIVFQKINVNSPSCNVWFYLFTTTALMLVSVVWCIVARWYKNRERDEPDRGRIYVENYYDHYCTLENP